MPITSIYGHWAIPVTTQSGAYTVQTRDFGSCIQANGATTFTLPAPGPELNGVWVKVMSIAAGDMVVTAGTGKIVALNNAAVDTVTWGTNGEEIGSGGTFLCDGTDWLLFNDLSGVTSTVTIA